MKFFFRVVTKTTARPNGAGGRSRAKSALIIALAAFCGLGCVGRKQYAINEAVLISERRQLDDEVYRLQFELRDALEENERLRQELGDDANAPAKSRQRARSNANDAFFPGLDASQTQLRTTGGAQTPASPTGEAVETLPDYVPIPTTSTRSGAARNGAQSAPIARNPQGVGVRTAQRSASASPAGKTLGVRREIDGERVVPVAASESNGGNVVSSVFVGSPSTKEKRAVDGAPSGDPGDWSPLAQ
ncbi:MAG: hypothetical protein IJO46_03815 [Thermoguttaceae bacterium]|nr:hypothetical protein [Thermoguttaceae bacterium]